MNKHFHYYAIKIIAREAGFSEKESDIIAYASQYVDDATEHKKIAIREVPVSYTKKTTIIFDPTCTAHKNIQYLSCFKKDVQRKVYIPFHFIPDDFYLGDQKYSYAVLPGGKLSSKLLDSCLIRLKTTQDGDNIERLCALIGTGIALHSYADTWAHQFFSGRRNSKENDISARKILKNGEWINLKFFKNLFLNILPDIGHAEAEGMPDDHTLVWKYKSNKLIIERNNTEIFTVAAMNILEKLCSVIGKEVPNIRTKFFKCLNDYQGLGNSIWSLYFPNIIIQEYDFKKWREEALSGHCDWDNFKKESEFLNLHVEYKGDPKWFIFHEEAKRQRNYIINNIRYDLK